jgi:hypothetical protein
LELLLLLTAMLASLTGIGSGERARQVQGVAVVQAAQAAQVAVSPARRILPQATIPFADVLARSTWVPHAAASLPATYLPFERRLE